MIDKLGHYLISVLIVKVLSRISKLPHTRILIWDAHLRIGQDLVRILFACFISLQVLATAAINR